MLKTEITLDDKRLKRITGNLRPGARAAVMTTAREIEAEAKLAIQNPPKTGELYGNHQASKPGEAPATDTGNLVNSIGVERESDTSAWVWVGAEYGAALEFGTSRIEKRPYMTPAAEKAQPHFHERMEDLFR